MKNKQGQKKSNSKSKKLLFLERILRFLSIRILKKYKPRIIGITGSIGKTSSKEAVFSVLSSCYRVRKNEKNYNNEIGLPLTIIGLEGGESSILRWIGIFFGALKIIIFSVEYPEILILEMGADRPGDIAYLTGFIECEVAIITDISGSHLEYFKTIDKVAQEKWILVEKMKNGGIAVVNIDNAKILKLKDQNKREDVKFITFGFSVGADVQTMEVFYNYNENNEGKEIKGLSFKLDYKGTSIPIRLNNILAQHSIYAALSAVAVGIIFKINLVQIALALENFSMPAGRMNLIFGIKNTYIIDDTYNASPVSTISALEVLKDIKALRKIAVLGDMLELGGDNEKGHVEVAKKFLEINNGIIFAVGERMHFAVKELRNHQIDSGRIFEFADPMSAGKKLQEIIKSGDLILVKGSQGMRMEKIVEEIMVDPENTKKLLCRQSISWKNIPWRKV